MNEMANIGSTYFHQTPGMEQVRHLVDGASEKGSFAQLLENARARVSSKDERPGGQPTIEEAAKQMEVQLTTLMLQTMEKTSTEGGLLGSKMQGMGYFKDVFLQSIAENMVENSGMGFAESLQNTYGVKGLAP